MDENSSNALLIAGGVLISVMIISLGVLIFRTSADFAIDYQSNIDTLAIQSFNSKFEVYDRTNVKIQDIVSIANYANEENIKNEVKGKSFYDNQYHVEVTVDGISNGRHLEEKTESELFELMTEQQKTTDTSVTTNIFKCKKIEYGEDTLKVRKIIFEFDKETKN